MQNIKETLAEKSAALNRTFLELKKRKSALFPIMMMGIIAAHSTGFTHANNEETTETSNVKMEETAAKKPAPNYSGDFPSRPNTIGTLIYKEKLGVIDGVPFGTEYTYYIDTDGDPSTYEFSARKVGEHNDRIGASTTIKGWINYCRWLKPVGRDYIKGNDR
ncbi:MAG: hypothetical protein LBU87_06025 [Lactobacillales bacterium]|jgi:hypothetical protein|nr:hypothetical protein [Lactobacillales bacterium]